MNYKGRSTEQEKMTIVALACPTVSKADSGTQLRVC